MEVIFGQSLNNSPMPSAELGLSRIVVGPMGLLDLLELRLGLPPAVIDPGLRQFNYLKALERYLPHQPFYTTSFNNDPYATARVLLTWRDQLIVEGWSPEVCDSKSETPKRLKDLAGVEAFFEATSEDIALRIDQICCQLDNGRKPQIETVKLVGPLTNFSQLWRQLLDRLPIDEDAFPAPNQPLAKKGTILHAAQQHLLTGATEFNLAHSVSEDRSLQIVEDSVLNYNGIAAGNYIKQLPRKQSQCIISSSNLLNPVDTATHSIGLPRVGQSCYSASSALLQLVPLIIRLHWAPFNPQAWMEFFLHPISPLSSLISRKLASELNRCPARNEIEWQNCISKALEGLDSEQSKAINKQINDWLSPVEFDTEADCKTIQQTIVKISKWMTARASIVDKEIRGEWLQAVNLISPLKRSFSIRSKLDRLTVERILSEWLANVNQGENYSSELGAPQRLSQACQLLTPVDHLIWWQPQEPTIPKLPWTKSEIAFLRSHQVVFPDRSKLIAQAQKNTHRAILNAKQSVCLFECTGDGHLEIPISPLLVRLRTILPETIIKSPEELIETETVAVQFLPKKETQWQLHRPHFVVPRTQESFSSLSKLINLPYEWILDYQARIRKGVIADYRVVDDVRRQGSLLHGFVESLLEPDPDPLQVEERNLLGAGSDEQNQQSNAPSLLAILIKRLFEEDAPEDWKTIDQAAIESWVENHWNEILSQQAAHYLVEGNEASRSELLFVAKKGLWNLILHLRSAKVVQVTCEERIDDVDFIGGKLGGFIDLRVTNETGDVAVIDLKLGGKTYRLDELKKGRHLQLAVYGHLVREIDQIEPLAAYFIFSGGGTLLARSDQYFPKATIASSKPIPAAQDWQYCWREFIQRYQQRTSEFSSGKIIVPIETYDSTLPFTWRVREPAKYSNYKNLMGWTPAE